MIEKKEVFHWYEKVLTKDGPSWKKSLQKMHKVWRSKNLQEKKQKYKVRTSLLIAFQDWQDAHRSLLIASQVWQACPSREELVLQERSSTRRGLSNLSKDTWKECPLITPRWNYLERYLWFPSFTSKNTFGSHLMLPRHHLPHLLRTPCLLQTSQQATALQPCSAKDDCARRWGSERRARELECSTELIETKLLQKWQGRIPISTLPQAIKYWHMA